MYVQYTILSRLLDQQPSVHTEIIFLRSVAGRTDSCKPPYSQEWGNKVHDAGPSHSQATRKNLAAEQQTGFLALDIVCLRETIKSQSQLPPPDYSGSTHYQAMRLCFYHRSGLNDRSAYYLHWSCAVSRTIWICVVAFQQAIEQSMWAYCEHALVRLLWFAIFRGKSS